MDPTKTTGPEMLSSVWFRRSLILATIFNVSALASYFYCPDWMWMYFPEDAHTSAFGLIYVFALLYYLPLVASYILTQWMEVKKPNSSYAWIAGMGALNVYIVAALFDRYFHVGTRAEYLSGVAKTLADPTNAVALPMNVGGAALGAYGVYCIVRRVKLPKAA